MSDSPDTSEDFEQVAETNDGSTAPSEDATPAPADGVVSKDEPPAIQQHPEMSFEDGNFVIIAGHTAYRVHRGVMSRKSALFKDLLSLPQPDSEEKYDGLPVVRLLDPAEDVTMLLDAIYNGAK